MAGQGVSLSTAVAAVLFLLLAFQWLAPSGQSLEEQVGVISAEVQALRRASASLTARGGRGSAERAAGGVGAAVANLSAAVAAVRRGTSAAKRPPLRRGLRWRWELAQVLEEEGKLHGAEIGVQQASFSYDMLRLWPACRRYVLIDVWKHQENYAEGANVADAGHDWLYNKAMDRLAKWKDKLVVLRNWSHDASFQVEEGSLDFVYVDARHDFESALEDMRDWWPKLRAGGLFAGHDYTTARKGAAGFALQRDGTRDARAVVGAVEQFSKEVQRGYYVIPESKSAGRRAPFASWVMRK
eukprot:TRINITY_DN33076_c0_g1_i1.p2 TRINITY_DN33076_c0_g1~~TRINITY_DN33076_c0_g1_i1.p2  ORF type:complete len:314 (+),score=118.07 TRINITY_DN33076_c0_g1_i1:49-942(+)